ncbi:MAG TPA: hypothetical protein VF755_19675 [Catenuloplanes sp.]|jgi:antitoxin (DNA-binding transcriptional repressor) of toxin-antitoxin stability system
MTSAHELPADDPGALSEAVNRAAAGEVVRLVAADGRRVADVTPPKVSADASETDVQRADRVTRAFFAATGATPTLEHYKSVYAKAGAEWPGDDVARNLFPVAEAS